MGRNTRNGIVITLCAALALYLLVIRNVQVSYEQSTSAPVFSGQSPFLGLPLLLPQEEPPWTAFTAAPGSDVAQCFFEWEKGQPFAVWGFPDNVMSEHVLPILSSFSQVQLEGSFCRDIAKFAKITPLNFGNIPFSRRGLLRLDMAQRSRAYTWYFFVASTGCEQSDSAWLPMVNWTVACHQVGEQRHSHISADYLLDVPELLGMLVLSLLAFSRLPAQVTTLEKLWLDEVGAQAHGSSEGPLDVRRAGIAGLAISFASAAVHMHLLSKSGIRVQAMAWVAELASFVGHMAWTCSVLSSGEAAPQSSVHVFSAIALTSPILAGVLVETGCATSIGVRDGLLSSGDYALLAEWLLWFSGASVAAAFSAQRGPWEQLWRGAAMAGSSFAAAMVAAMAVVCPDTLRIISKSTPLVSLIALIGVGHAMLTQRSRPRDPEESDEHPNKSWRHGGQSGCQGISILLWVAALPVSSLPFIVTRERHFIRLTLLLASQALRLADLSGFDLAQFFGRHGVKGPRHSFLLLCRYMAARLSRLSWHWLLLFCFVAAMVLDALDYLGTTQQRALEARIKDLPIGNEMEAKLAEVDKGSLKRTNEVRDQLMTMSHDISELRSLSSKTDFLTREFKTKLDHSQDLIQRGWSQTQMLVLLEKSGELRSILKNNPAVPGWWKVKEEEVFSEGCRFRRYDQSSLGGLTEDGISDLSPGLALAACVRTGIMCKGISCRESGGVPFCTPRRGTPWLYNEEEVSYKKECDPSFAGPVFDGLPAVGERAQGEPSKRDFIPGTKLVLLAHTGQDIMERQLQVILGELSGRGLDKPDVFVSCNEPAMQSLLAPAAQRQAEVFGRPVGFWNCTLSSCLSPNSLETRTASHYRFVLGKAFDELHASFVILLGEDRIPSPDFLLFFQASQEVLVADETLWCASAWNDRSLLRFARDPARMTRTSTFPGIAWMVSTATWGLLRPAWPSPIEKPATPLISRSWEQWLSVQPLATSRECLQPEVSRVYRRNPAASEYFSLEEGNNFGQKLDYLHQERYEKRLKQLVANSTRLDFHDAVAGRYGAPPEAPPAAYVVPFSPEEWPQFAEPAGLRTPWFPRIPGSDRGLLIVPDYDKHSVLFFADRTVPCESHIYKKDCGQGKPSSTAASVAQPVGSAGSELTPGGAK